MAALYKHLRFAGLTIVTIVAGEISEFHVGLKRTADHRDRHVSVKLADMITGIDAADWLTLATAWRLDQELEANRQIAQAKLFASEMLARVTDEAVQIFGGIGLMDDLPVERFWRDARVERNGVAGACPSTPRMGRDGVLRHQPIVTADLRYACGSPCPRGFLLSERVAPRYAFLVVIFADRDTAGPAKCCFMDSLSCRPRHRFMSEMVTFPFVEEFSLSPAFSRAARFLFGAMALAIMTTIGLIVRWTKP